MQNLRTMFTLLLEHYGPQSWWPAEDAFAMMVGAILTQNTLWRNVTKAIDNFAGRLTPEFIAMIDTADLAEIIRCSGYYQQKALKLKALTVWYEKYGYQIEAARAIEGQILRQELLAIKGVGPETADSILTYALHKPFFVVDAYTKRIFFRLGYQLGANYEGIRLAIENNIAKDLYIYNEFHALIVEHAKQYCQKTPCCQGCPLGDVCPKTDIMG